MCDYSLSALKSRPAKVGDKLESHFFPSGTRGLKEVGGCGDTAVCLRPGTELAFDDGRVARFREINLDNERAHHDAFEFANGDVVLVHCMPPSTKCTVLQLGLDEKKMHAERQVQYTYQMPYTYNN